MKKRKIALSLILCLTINGVLLLPACGAESEQAITPILSLLLQGNVSEDDGFECDSATVTTSTGKTWMACNLGASRIAQSYDEEEAYGDLYQWGRGKDGHEKRDSATTTTLSTTDTPGHGSFILPSGSPYDWRSPQNDNLWQGVSGTNNPCPSGYRLPTITELQAEVDTWSSEDSAGAYGSPLKLVVAGYRYHGSGAIYSAGSGGYYWTSTVDGTYGRYLRLNSADAYVYYSSPRANGYSVRCVED